METNLISLLSESLARHVQTVLANDTALLLVTSDTATSQVSQCIFSPCINSSQTLPADSSLAVSTWTGKVHRFVRHLERFSDEMDGRM